MTSFAGVIAALAAVPLLAQSPAGASLQAPEVVALGRGEARLRPDRAILTLGVVTRAATAGQAGRLNADRVAPVLAALRRLGLPDSAMSTSGYTVDQDDSDESRPAVAGRARPYIARNAVRVSVLRLDMLSAIVDTALAAGATEIGQITLESSQASEGRRRAILAATLDARAEAAAAAVALGGTLGSTIEVVIDPNGGRLFGGQTLALQSVVVTGALGRSVPTALLPGELTTVVQVRLRAALLPSAK